MTDATFIILYGLLFISGCFMLPAWTKIARQSAREGDKDFTRVSWALAIGSAGTAAVFGFRIAYGFITSLWSLKGWFGVGIVIGMILLQIGKIMLMNVRRDHGSVWTWRAFAVLSLAWTAFGAMWVIR